MNCQTQWNCSKRKFGLDYTHLLCQPYNPAFTGNTPFSLPTLLMHHPIYKISKHCVQAEAKFKLHKLIILYYYELTAPHSPSLLEYYSSSTRIKENLTLYKQEQITAAEVTSGQPLLLLNGIDY